MFYDKLADGGNVHTISIDVLLIVNLSVCSYFFLAKPCVYPTKCIAMIHGDCQICTWQKGLQSILKLLEMDQRQHLIFYLMEYCSRSVEQGIS